jgi:type II secretory pathway component PulF
MPLILTPGQFARRAEFYHQLAQLTSAGIGLPHALEQLKRNPPARSFCRPIQQMLQQINAGNTFTESLQLTSGWLPVFDIALLDAGERSGRLDACFQLLADYYNDRARITRQMISDLAYPMALLHLAIFIFPFAKFFMSGNLLAYLAQTFGVLFPIYLIIVVMIYAGQSKHGERWRAWVESLLHPIPMLGTGRHYLALSRLAAALEALINAGVTIIEAWELAAAASGSPALRRAVHAWKPQLRAGETPAEVVRACPRFPEIFANLYSSGEISGKLDETLRQLRRIYQEEGTRKLHAVAQCVPRFIYLAVALMIGYRVVQFWTGYFKQVQDAGGF